jgi:ABC-type sugar transport system ATPase subunit
MMQNRNNENIVMELRGITKTFPGVKSLDNVNFTLYRGEVHALVGENGAGKSTLMKIMAGIYKPESGEIYYKGKLTNWASPLEAKKNGISVIHQELQLAPNLTVAENVLMGTDLPKNRFGIVNWEEINKRAKELLVSIGSDLDPKQIVSQLSVSQQQIVEIARALSIKADIIIMDEPSATLTDKEIMKLFTLINLLKSRGIAVVYVSHRMEEIFQISDRCTVLRDGQWIATLNTKNITEQELVKLMVGRDVSHIFNKGRPKYERKIEVPLLETEKLSDGGILKDGTINVYPGEIVGISGLVGSGRSELLRAIFGASKVLGGEIKINGQKVSIKSPVDAINHGIALIPESRKEQGLFLQLGVGENISVLKLNKMARLGFIKRGEKRELEKEYIKKLTVKTSSIENQIANLSGGNQQKAIIARWLTIKPKILLLDEPTRGIDVGAKTEIYDIIKKLASQGIGVIVVSSDLPEILSISNRVFVMCEGKIVAELQENDINQETIMMYAAGSGK